MNFQDSTYHDGAVHAVVAVVVGVRSLHVASTATVFTAHVVTQMSQIDFLSLQRILLA